VKLSKITTLLFVVFVLFTFVVYGKSIQNLWEELAVIKGEQINYSNIPSPYQMQQLLNLLEPDNPIKVDGKIGPQTMAKWNEYICDRNAERTFDEISD
jgi:hypothetical protein